MSGFKGFVKEGWHPKGNDGGRESWRGDFKGINQVAGWVGKGKSSGSAAYESPRASKPISSLRDPASFGPPPRRTNTAGLQASHSTEPTTRHQPEQSRESPAGVAPRPAPPPPPRRSNDISTAGGNNAAIISTKPSLPPRLPPRRESSEQQPKPASPPPAYESAAENPAQKLNQAALNRLVGAGVSVPALNITRAPVNPQTTQAAASIAQSELQQRFSQMNRSNAPTPQRTSSDTTTAEDKSRVTYPLSTSTPTPTPASVNSFRERHNDHIQAGMSKLSVIDQKYGISKKINNFIEDQKSPAYPPGQHAQPSPHPSPPGNNIYSPPDSNCSRPDLNNRKPPPPPPPMKPNSLSSNAVSHFPSPPPLPLNTKPR